MRARKTLQIGLCCVVLFVAGFSDATPPKRRIQAAIVAAETSDSDSSDHGRNLFTELLEEIAKREKWELSVVVTKPQDGMARLEKGDLDVLAPVANTGDAPEHCRLTQETVVSTWGQVYTSKKKTMKSLLELSGLDVGILRDDPFASYFRSMLKSLGISARLVEFNDYRGIIAALEKQWIEAGVIDRLYGLMNEGRHPLLQRTDIIFCPVEHRFAVSRTRGDAISTALDYHLAWMKKDRTSVYHRYFETVGATPVESRLSASLKAGSLVAVLLLFASASLTILFRWRVKNKTFELLEKNRELESEIAGRRQAEEILRHQKECLSALHDTSLELMGRLDLADLLENIVRRAANLSGTGHGFLYLLDDESGLLKMEAAAGLFQAQVGTVIGAASGLAGRVFSAGGSEKIDHYAAWPHRLAASPYDRLRAAAATSLEVSGRRIGVIGLGRDDHAPFHPDAGDLLKRFGEMAALAIHNARLYRALQDELDARRRMELALEESETLYRHIFENTGTATIIVDRRGKVVMANGEAEVLAGCSRSEMEGRPWEALFQREDRKPLGLPAAEAPHPAAKPLSFEAKIRNRQDRLKFILIRIGTVPAAGQTIVSILDVTERKKLENQLQQSQKMEAIGRFAGGIAHDFNNILVPIIGHAEISLRLAKGQASFRERIDKIRVAACRARELVNQILSFSRKREIQPTPVDLRRSVEEIFELLRASIPSTIDLSLDIADCDAVVTADAAQIHQIIMNLCANASDALKDKGGRLTIALGNAEIHASGTLHPAGLPAGSYCRLAVTDTGHGMDDQTMEKIFEPFFTTKQEGEGTGMGLSIVQGIVKSLQGAIRVESEPGIGTTFEVLLPRRSSSAVRESNPHPAVLQGGSREKILLVDDERSVAETTDDMLQMLGYDVVVATSGREALRLFRSGPTVFDLIVTDHTMPALSGIELAREILSIRPEMPILISTGFCDGMMEKKAKTLGIQGIIRKPYVMEELAGMIRETLNGQERT